MSEHSSYFINALTLYRFNSWLTMKKFHDVEIYSGRRLATTGSRLEIGASNKFLREIFSGLADCASCREPLVLIFPDEEESTLREAFNRLSHFKSALSIIESKFPLHWSYLSSSSRFTLQIRSK